MQEPPAPKDTRLSGRISGQTKRDWESAFHLEAAKGKEVNDFDSFVRYLLTCRNRVANASLSATLR